MIFLLSPAKTLDYDSPLPHVTPTQPQFLEHSQELINILKKLSTENISELMSLSDKLASLNHDRYQQWTTTHESSHTCRPALLAFKGDVYLGLDAASFSTDDLHYAQDHLRILSGLYGLIRPLDFMQAYRLEMGTKLPNKRGKNLYDFWRGFIANEINQFLESQQSQAIVNLASNEYFSAVDQSKLTHPVVTPVFKDYKNGKYKIISFYAKKARGSMAAWALKNRIDSIENLGAFTENGYHLDDDQSSENELVFLRKQAE